MNNILSVLILLLCTLGFSGLTAQEVSVSSELNIRNYYAYDLLGEVGDRYLIYRDKGFIKEIDVFNEYLEHTQYAELILEKKKSDIIHAQGLDSIFQIIYTYAEGDTLFTKMRRYDATVSLKDSLTLIKTKKDILRRRMDYVLSEDEQLILLYSMDKDGIFHFYLYDNRVGKITKKDEVEFTDFDQVKDKFVIKLSDAGKLIMLFHDKDSGSRSSVDLWMVRHDLASDPFIFELEMGGKFRRDYYLDIDNVHDKVILCGTYSEKRGKDPQGFYFVNASINSFKAIESPMQVPFTEELIEEVSRSKKKKNKVFQNFWIRDVIKRQDGGLLVMMEHYREFSRRSSYASGYDRVSYGPIARRGWVDYYNEDIIATSFNPQLEIDWSKILYKKQFSQDDDAIFSSFFVMKTPSRLRLVYNDEIKSGNTVSEYIMDPTGKVKRNSLLSTHQQEMKLRFRDAIQLSNHEILVPSETAFELNLVKITY